MSAVIRDVSDTALWAAVYRARENERERPVFRDPLARKLAGTRGDEIAAQIPFSEKNAWSWIARTYLFDRFIEARVREGTDTVLNLGAGLDTRPYRAALPPSLRWIEVDLPGLLEYKKERLADEKPGCHLERIALDVADVTARRALFRRIGDQGRRVLVVTEGLMIYLTAAQAVELAEDLAVPQSFQDWVLDLANPGLMRMLQKNIASQLRTGGAALQFAPAEGAAFFEPHGWQPTDVQGLMKTAARLHRAPLLMRLLSLLPEPRVISPSRPWAGVCLLTRRPLH